MVTKQILESVCSDCGIDYLTEYQKKQTRNVTAYLGECYICNERKLVTSSRHYNYLVKRNWYDFYKNRINTDYQQKFERNYQPFLNKILSLKPDSIVEIGCGIGSVSKFLHQYDIDILCVDICEGMIDLAKKNNKDWATSDNFVVKNINDIHPIHDFCITHGMLEHYEDDVIFEFLKKMPYSIHYVPLDKWVIPSFGDERLLSFKHWVDLTKPKEYCIFNEGKDFWFLIDNR